MYSILISVKGNTVIIIIISISLVLAYSFMHCVELMSCMDKFPEIFVSLIYVLDQDFLNI